MPLRNSICILLVAVASLVCFERRDRSPYGRYFSEVIDKIDHLALVEISQQELWNAALEGMIEKMHDEGDQHSAFYPWRKVTDFNQDIHSEYIGVGIQIELHPQLKQPIVVAAFYGSPAYKAGIQAGDVIVAVNGHSTKEDKKLKDVIARIMGDVGDKVILRVLHPEATQPVDVTIVCGHISIPTIRGDRPGPRGTWSYYIDGYDKIAYIRMLKFSDKSTDDLKSAIERLQSSGMKALILDLRGNPGGQLDVAITTCDLFLEKDQVIVSTKDRRGSEDQPPARASGKGTFTDFPMAVMVNQRSASASEIVAACLQDHQRAVVVGQRSYGKGTVQNVISIEGGRSRLKLTTSTYWRPSGKDIHRQWKNGKLASPEADWGVMPDDNLRLEIDDKERSRVIEARRLRDFPMAPPRLTQEKATPKTKPDPTVKNPVKSPAKNSEKAKPEGEQTAPSGDSWPRIDQQLMLALEYLQNQVAD